MFIYRDREQGMAAKCAEVLTGGMIVKVAPNVDGELVALKVADAADSAARIGIAYVDQAKQHRTRGVERASTALGAAQILAVDDVISCLHGRVRGMTDQLVDGVYNPGDKLTIHWATARLTHATFEERVYGSVSLEYPGGAILSQNRLVPVQLELPGGMETLPADPGP
jgi:hypothetical protein